MTLNDPSAEFMPSIDSGRAVLVVHGGPGLDHTYLTRWLQPLRSEVQLHFYDQLGCGSDSTPVADVSADAMIQQLIAILETFRDKGISLLTHSWGSYLLYEALRRSQVSIDSILMLSPVGLTRERFDHSADRFVARIPSDVLATLEKLDADGAGTEFMTTALPYYVADGAHAPPVTFDFYSPSVYNKVMDTLGDYDCRDLAARHLPPTMLVYGASDVEIPEGTTELHPQCDVQVIAGAGHFLFAEKPTDFIELARRFFSK